jgi:hypothetical protein
VSKPSPATWTDRELFLAAGVKPLPWEWEAGVEYGRQLERERLRDALRALLQAEPESSRERRTA